MLATHLAKRLSRHYNNCLCELAMIRIILRVMYQLSKTNQVAVVMPETAPACKQALIANFGAEILHYDISTDHITGVRDELAHRITTVG